MMCSAIFAGAKRLLATAILAGALATMAGAAAATEWRGGGHASSFRNCGAGNWPDGHIAMIGARYRPSGLPNNANFSRLSFIFDVGAEHYRTERGRFRNSFAPVVGVGVWSGGWQFQNGPRLRVLQHQPRNLGTETDVVRLRVRVRGFNDISGCVVDFDVTLHRR